MLALEITALATCLVVASTSVYLLVRIERLERRLAQQELTTYRHHERIQSLRKDADLSAEWTELATKHIINIKKFLGGKNA